MILTRRCKLMFQNKLAVTLENSCQIGHKRRCSQVHLEPAVYLGDNTLIETPFIGMGTSIGSNTVIKFTSSIGRFTTINNNCVIGGKISAVDTRVSLSMIMQDNTLPWYKNFLCMNNTYAYTKREKTVVGNDVWIGDNVLITENVVIGNGAVIESGSVVSENVPAYAVVKGNPAEVVGFRFEPKIIKRLEQIKWWDYGISLFNEVTLSSLSIDEVVSILEKKCSFNKKIPLGENGFLLAVEEKSNSIYRVTNRNKEILYRISDMIV